MREWQIECEEQFKNLVLMSGLFGIVIFLSINDVSSKYITAFLLNIQ